jgi:hypothetical protein
MDYCYQKAYTRLFSVTADTIEALENIMISYEMTEEIRNALRIECERLKRAQQQTEEMFLADAGSPERGAVTKGD